jgi:hypothetical protein
VSQAPSLSLQEELVFWGHTIALHRKLLRFKYRVWYVTQSTRQTGDHGEVKFCFSAKQCLL